MLSRFHARCSRRSAPIFFGIVSVAIAGLLSESSTAQTSAPADQVNAIAVANAVERIGREIKLWPGFDPSSVPLAIYTGSHTFLFRHPSPPEGFARVAENVFVFAGRHPAIVANTSEEIGGKVTATLEAMELGNGAAGDQTVKHWSAIALHESFHVYQLRQHPDWRGNEAVAFLYPVDNPRLLSLRRLESLALARAADHKETAKNMACWVRRALEARHERFAAMDADFSDYERLTELNEGLASYVELRAQNLHAIEIPKTEYAPTAVRQRAYVIGTTLAFLLDELRPGWQDALNKDDKKFLDQLLDSVTAMNKGGAERCAFTADERAAAETTAKNDVTVLSVSRTESRKQFDALQGWRVRIESADGAPLQLQGFDPLNVQLIDGGVLHTRMLSLANANGKLQMLRDGNMPVRALSVPSGAHPLFEGTKQITIAGLARPEMARDGKSVTLRSAGFSAEFKSADVSEDGTTMIVRLSTLK